MKLVDANVLIAACANDHPHHAMARQWLEQARARSETLGLSVLVALAFLRIVTNGRINANPLTGEQALDWLRSLTDSPAVRWLHPDVDHLSILDSLLRQTGAAGNLINDAHLAALALEHGASVVTFDRDFLRFQGLRTELLGG